MNRHFNIIKLIYNKNYEGKQTKYVLFRNIRYYANKYEMNFKLSDNSYIVEY